MVPLVCIPGTLCDSAVFAPIAAGIDAELILAPTIAQGEVEAAADAVLQIAPPRFICLGFSLGSFVGWELMRRVPDRLAGMVVIAGNARSDPPQNADMRHAQLALAEAEGPAALIDTLWELYLAAGNRADQRLRAAISDMAERVGVDPFDAQTALAIGRPDSRDDIAAFPGPMLLIRGSEDPLCPADRLEEIASAAVDATIVTIEQAGHFVTLEAPDAVSRAIAGWMAERVR